MSYLRQMISPNLTTLLVILALAVGVPTRLLAQNESSEESMAAYADAANFQTGGAIDLAIKGWQDFLKKYPKHSMASKAAHYLGVCYMQKEAPDLEAACDAFAQATQDRKYDLREESLANYGWCLYASAGIGEKRDAKKLKQSAEIFSTLRKENPKSRFLDRSLFYCGEAAYGIGDSKKAIQFYDELLTLPSAKESPLRCDALYARGVAQEDLKEFEKAFASYKQLLDGCKESELATDVHLRMGDLMIMQKKYDRATQSFDAAIKSTDSEEDQSYALFRQAFALVQAEQPSQAAKKYEQLLKEFPDSPYAASATLASAQSSYRGGDLQAASKKFQEVLGQQNANAATEAAHWMARIAIANGEPDEAIKTARAQIDKGAKGEFATELKLDLAEALSMNPTTIKESLDLFEQTYRESTEDELAPRALYNAAFSALQLNNPKKALELATEFTRRFPRDTLSPDVQFVAAEGLLLTGQAEQAAAAYDALIASTAKDNIQRPVWVLRAATTSNASRKFDHTVELLKREFNTLSEPAQKVDAYMLVGQAQMMRKRPGDAAAAFASAEKADPKGRRAEEARLMAGQALLSDNKREQAIETWKSIIQSNSKSRMADQARYKLAQQATESGDFESAIKHFDEIVNAKRDLGLLPYAAYGKGFALLQAEKYQQAIVALDAMMKGYKNHPLQNDAMLTRGISLRNLGQFDRARNDLETYLAIPPRGTNLGHALYELALIDQKEKQPGKAAEKLKRLVKEVPDYPDMDKVLYELGWSLQESGDDEDAINHFTSLIAKFPNTSLVAEASYFVGQKYYRNKDWKQAARQFSIAAEKAKDESLSEKALYRLGWSHFKSTDFKKSETAFSRQAKKHPDGKLTFDALMMVGECHFKQADYADALAAFQVTRDRIQKKNESSSTIRDAAERQARELVLLHGGQSASQQKQFDQAINWFDELRQRFPATDYLPQVFYETGFAYQQKGDSEKALKFYSEVANNYRSELAARARFMMGEIHFAERELNKAIPEFQRVMFGFGAEKASESIKNWQAKSGFEAGRCSDLLTDMAKTNSTRTKAQEIAKGFYGYVVEKHPKHELAEKSKQRIEALTK